MSLVERLQAAAKRYDRRARSSAADGNYDFTGGDMRDLLEEAANALKQVVVLGPEGVIEL